ncbi:hypothetical protein [Kitasatospora sp. NPDC097643]|uniref:hypothetical protein n=1 Tax=Kitasatospora sp. NPDC097643 TaxID=3157230 RepID=UPI003329519D
MGRPNVGARRLRVAAVALCLPLVLGGCMSWNDPNSPLPVRAREDTQGWARQLTESMARTAGVTLDPGSAEPEFEDCVGEKGEVATDGRYTMSYAVYSSAPLDQHPEAVRRIRAMLEQQKYTIKGYRETVDGKVAALMDAYQPSDRDLVSVETTVGGKFLLFRIGTRCLMPPTPQ